ncbi:geranylgeranylglyceryl/heptaprenylglyceryl phosphate synthase [Leptobacterium flavescens]|uniref:Geranylgeranylglyceryl phosphate synthase n=1 Tax=Leptobacterium flavescens TaxID=472055 RepID=A0A6P0URG2_9FLAO|nr:geranylgeranylglyceryl/heptaprenylglyceryl phosphate synthase [Leptobacterium flavescens]NER14558.1 geranylgeranylglyceryl/heptaprenylglyceryl phosphate synthase [Leptobacterium flavescens]
MINNLYRHIANARVNGEKLLAVLIDPDKISPEEIPSFIKNVNQSVATHIFVGGSTVEEGMTEQVVKAIKKYTVLPVILFPGDESQITEEADGLLFLSLLSGRNPEYLIDQHVRAVPKLISSELEIIPTSYLLIDGGKKTSTQKVSRTSPIDPEDRKQIVHTALAGEFLGHKLIYLEAGSGAKYPIPPDLIGEVCTAVSIPVIVGGGIRQKEQIDAAYTSGADMVVIGTAFEQDHNFFKELKKAHEDIR